MTSFPSLSCDISTLPSSADLSRKHKRAVDMFSQDRPGRNVITNSEQRDNSNLALSMPAADDPLLPTEWLSTLPW